ncbi:MULTISPECIES: hypothetical protein [Bacillus]|uniref:hypothetical protein n=1 Tax=Bacillus TaxID=1386 RepID=UPI00031EB17D|nr:MULTISPECIES: hypothetical protein [Bacillus]
MKQMKALILISIVLVIIGLFLMFSSYSLSSLFIKPENITDSIEATTRYAMVLNTYPKSFFVLGSMVLGSGLLIAVFTLCYSVVLKNFKETA